MQTSGNYQFNEWWIKHQESYVSHATYNMNVIHQKLLRCAEEVFRLEGAVEHELGYLGVRKVSTEFKPSGDPRQSFTYHTGCTDEDNEYLNCMVIPDFAINSNYFKVLESRGEAIEDKGSYVKVYCEEYVPLEGTLTYSQDLLRRKTLPADKVASKTMYLWPGGSYLDPNDRTNQNFEVSKLSYQDDEKAGRKVDHSLRAIYQDLTSEGLCPNRLAYIIYSLRNKVFDANNHKLSSDIRVEKNGVRWVYGNMAILMGNPQTRLPWEGAFSDKTRNHCEFSLRQPFQTPIEEGFYKVSLTDNDVIVVCEETKFKELQRDPKIDPQLKARLINLNTLTVEQKKHITS